MPPRRSRTDLLRGACTVVAVLDLGAVAAVVTARVVDEGVPPPVGAVEQQPAVPTTVPPVSLDAPATTVVRAERTLRTAPSTTAPPPTPSSTSTTSTTAPPETTTTTTATTAPPTPAPSSTTTTATTGMPEGDDS